MNHSNEQKLIELISEGNRLAFNQLYELYWKDLFNYSYKILDSKELAEDVVQDVFLKVWKNRSNLEVYNIKSYLYNAARNGSISKIRESKFTQIQLELIEHIAINASGEEKLHFEDLEKKIEAVSQSLPQRCKEIFYLSRVKNYTIDEIAKEFNISKRTVENQIHLALKHIRPNLTDVAVLLIGTSIHVF